MMMCFMFLFLEAYDILPGRILRINSYLSYYFSIFCSCSIYHNVINYVTMAAI